MNYPIILAAIGVALLLTLVFSSGFSERGAGSGLIIFFLLVFMASWASQLWIRPMGPIWYGIAWVPLVFTASAAAFLLAWTGTATANTVTPSKEDDKETRNFFAALGFIFWVLVVIFLAAIVLGYYFPHPKPNLSFLD